MLTVRSTHLTLIGNGVMALNYFFCNSHILSIFSSSKKKTFFKKATNHKRLQPVIQFNKLTTHNKLNLIGFSFIMSNFLQSNFPNTYNLNNIGIKYLNLHIIINIILKQITTFRMLHTYKLLTLLKTNF